MSTLVITKAYSTGAAFTEAHLDNFRNGLITLFNTDKFDAANFSGGAISSTKFVGNTLIAANGTYIEFGNLPDAWMGPAPTTGNLRFDTDTALTVIELWADGEVMLFTDTEVTIPGDIVFNEGGSGRTLFQAFSSYHKPVLVWEASTAVSVISNSADSNETIIYFPSFVASVIESTPAKYRKADITNAARGYQTDATSTARGGRRDGLSLTSNSWYTVYAAKVRSGDDYEEATAKFVLVYDSTLPTDESTLDSRYGSGNWVYLGLVRYGFGDTGSSSAIPKFKQSNKGWTYFYGKSSSGYGGVNLSYSTSSSSDDPLYTLDYGMSGNSVPSIVGAIQVNLAREDVSDWWIEDASGDEVWRGGWQNDISTLPHGFQVELYCDSSFAQTFHQTVKGTGSVAKCVCLTGFCDSYHTLRRQGTGI